jgi:hypothetical protein
MTNSPNSTSTPLAALVARYRTEVDAFNNRTTDFETERAWALADATYNATIKQMIGVSARTAEDALDAIDLIDAEQLPDDVAASLVRSVRTTSPCAR